MGKQAKTRRARRAPRDAEPAAAEPAAEAAPPPGGLRRWVGLAAIGGVIALAVGVVVAATRSADGDASAPAGDAPAPAGSASGVPPDAGVAGPRPTEREPNDIPEKASPVRQLRSTNDAAADWAPLISRMIGRGALASSEDVDCHALPLAVPATGAVLALELTPSEASATPTVVVWSGDEPLRVVAGRPGAPIALPALGARAWVSQYVACVGGDAATGYQLEARLLAPRSAFEFEPNDGPAAATACPRNVMIEGFATAGDVDWFRIGAGPDAELVATLTGVAGVGTELALTDAEGEPLATATAGPAEEISLTASAPVYARVRAQSGANLDDRYRLIVRAEAGPR